MAKKKTNLKKLHRKLYELWKEVAKRECGITCLCCGRPAAHMHHYIPKSKSLALRYDLLNAIPLCNKCHYSIHFSNNPEVIRQLCEIIRKRKGEEWCFYIETKRREQAKNALWYFEPILKHLEDVWNKHGVSVVDL